MQFFLANIYPNVTSGNFFLLLFFFCSPTKQTNTHKANYKAKHSAHTYRQAEYCLSFLF
jgi:hypothetical protein